MSSSSATKITTIRLNEFDQPIGYPVENWTGVESPDDLTIHGMYGTLVPLNVQVHGRQLHEQFLVDSEGKDWTYLSYGPFPEYEAFERWMLETCFKPDIRFFVVIDAKNRETVGMLSLMRIDRVHGVIEIGHVHFSPKMQRSSLSTETIYSLIAWAFAAGYRRVEWKCDNLNARSKAAALRFGFQFEGLFRNALVYKGRNRDTAWFSIIQQEWPPIEKAFEEWLDPSNFDELGHQKNPLRTKI